MPSDEEVFDSSYRLVDRLADVPNMLQDLVDWKGPYAIDSTGFDEGLKIDSTTECRATAQQPKRIGVMLTLQIRTHHTWLVDVATLGHEIFDYQDATTQQTLRRFLTRTDLIKIAFDARNLSHMLFFRFQIRLGGIRELQVIEMNIRHPGRRKQYMYATLEETFAQWQEAVGRSLTDDFLASRQILQTIFGGAENAKRVTQRPFSPGHLAHCLLDVYFFVDMYCHYNTILDLPLTAHSNPLTALPSAAAHSDTKKRLQATCRPSFDPIKNLVAWANPLPSFFASPPSSHPSEPSTEPTTPATPPSDVDAITVPLSMLGVEKLVQTSFPLPKLQDTD